jgi:pimeloyl-ACP methyl ester carboxylesterase
MNLPDGITVRDLPGVNGLDMRVLQAGDPSAPLIVLLHGFPELAWSWRKVMLPLAEMGYHVIAPDQRGYGGTTGWDGRYDGDVRSFRMMNLARDIVCLVAALGRDHVAALVGHDFGSPVAAHCALLRPDIFRAVALMSAPYAGPPSPDRGGRAKPDLDAALAALDRPRRHYQWYYAEPGADRDMLQAPQGLHDFLRAYYHVKSADWPGNNPFPLSGWTAEELAKLPTYYVMDRGTTMPGTVAPEMPSAEHVAACDWLPDDELAVYAETYARTGFQGGLNWYRCAIDPVIGGEMELFHGRTIDVPSTFIAGAADWGIQQSPGALDAMQGPRVTSDFRGLHLIDGAGHWVQQEQPDAVVAALGAFLEGLRQ